VKQVSGRDFGMIIENQGWVLRRIRGSHHIYTKEGRVERISIPVHGNRSLKIGLLRALMKIAGVEESEL